MKTLHAYNFESVLTSIANHLHNRILPNVADSHTQKDIYHMELQLRFMANLVDDAVHNLVKENADIEKLLVEARKVLGIQLESTENIPVNEEPDLKLSNLLQKSSVLHGHIHKVLPVIDENNADHHPLFKQLQSLLCQINANRKAPLHYRCLG